MRFSFKVKSVVGLAFKLRNVVGSAFKLKRRWDLFFSQKLETYRKNIGLLAAISLRIDLAA